MRRFEVGSKQSNATLAHLLRGNGERGERGQPFSAWEQTNNIDCSRERERVRPKNFLSAQKRHYRSLATSARAFPSPSLSTHVRTSRYLRSTWCKRSRSCPAAVAIRERRLRRSSREVLHRKCSVFHPLQHVLLYLVNEYFVDNHQEFGLGVQFIIFCLKPLLK